MGVDVPDASSHPTPSTADLIAANIELNREEVHRGAVRIESRPLQMNVELTGICNVSPPCLFCSGKNFGHNYSALDIEYLHAYEDFLGVARQINEDSFGEPLSHPGLIELARRLTANGQVFSFVTNGLLLSRARAEALAACGPLLGMHVSFNAASSDTFYKLTGKPFDRVVANTRDYVAAYRRRNGDADLNLVLTFIVMEINRHEVLDFVRLAHEIGAPRILLAPLHDRPSVPLGSFGYDFAYEEEMLTYEALEAHGRQATRLADALGLTCLLQWRADRDSALQSFAEPDVDIPCLIPWRFLFIQEHTKRTISCPYHRHPSGDLRKHSIAEIWNGPEQTAMRAALANGEIPKRCWEVSAGCPLVMRSRQALDRATGLVGETIVMGENDLLINGTGWHALEREIGPARWTRRRATFRIQLGAEPRLRVIASRMHAAAPPTRVSLTVDGTLVGRVAVDSRGWQQLDFRIPGRPGQAVDCTLTVAQTWSPKALGAGPDTRDLGICVRAIGPVHEVDRISMGRDDFWHLTGAWHPVLADWPGLRWTGGNAAFSIITSKRRRLRLVLAAFRTPLKARLFINGSLVAKLEISDPGWQEIRLALPRWRRRPVSLVRILVTDLWEGDTRFGVFPAPTLGLALGEVWTQ